MDNPFIRFDTTFKIPSDYLKKMEDVGRMFRELNDRLSNDFAKIGEALRSVNEKLPESVAILAHNGWFISWWHTPLPDIMITANLFRSGDSDQGHAILCKHFCDLESGIRADLVKRYQSRRVIIEKAFTAHSNGDYELSIPVFLAQADGIAKEMLGVSVYSRKPHIRRKIAEVIEEFTAEGFHEPMLRLALEDLPLTASTNSPDYRQDALNRHGVLHGTDTDYPSRLNSFRALSLLQYAALFEEAARWSDNKKN